MRHILKTVSNIHQCKHPMHLSVPPLQPEEVHSRGASYFLYFIAVYSLPVGATVLFTVLIRAPRWSWHVASLLKPCPRSGGGPVLFYLSIPFHLRHKTVP